MSENQLVKLTLPENPAEIFVPEYVNTMLANIRQQATSIKADLDTAKGRKEIVAVAVAVAKSKVHIDGIGKDMVADWKDRAKVVDGLRKQVRDTLDDLRDEVRAPVTAWEEAEKERKQGIREEIEAIRRMPEPGADLDALVETCQLLNDMAIDKDTFMEMTDEAQEVYDAAVERSREALAKAEQAEEERRELDQLRKEKEERDAREAEEAAKRKAEEEARLEKERAEKEAQERKEREERIAREAAEKAQREAEERVEKAQREAAEREARLQREKEEAERREKEAAERAEREKQNAIEAERRRIAQEEADRKAEEDARQADEEHRGEIRKRAIEQMAEMTGIPMAKGVIGAIEDGAFDDITLNF